MASREAAGYDPRTAKQIQDDSLKRLAQIAEADKYNAGNGAQSGFSTGATRSTDANKIDFEGHINPEVLEIFGEYMNRHRVQRDGQLRASDNWQKGIPLYRYVKSLIRHTFEFWRMWRGALVTNPDNGQSFTFRDVLSAILFNVMGLMYEMNRHESILNAAFMTPALREAMERGDELKSEVSKKAYSDPAIGDLK